jgi:AGCS family alanine or glycine:cation symporter
MLSVAVLLFAFSTMLTWGYYGTKAWAYLFGDSRKMESLYKVIFCIFTFLGGMMTDIKVVVDFSTNLFLAMAIPNILGLYILRNVIIDETKLYIKKLKRNEFEKNW